MSDTRDLIDDHRVYFRIKRIGFPILAVLCVVLLVIVIALAVLYSQAADKSTSPTVKKPARKYEICNSDFCFDLGKGIVHNMNQSVDPCQDFFAYSCGGWQQRNPLRKGAEMTTVTTNLRILNIFTLDQELEIPSFNYTKNVAVMKMIQFYNSCKNETAIDSLGLTPLIKLIDKYGGWSIFNNTDENVSIETRIARAVRELGVDSLIKTEVETDDYNSSSNILALDAAALTFPESLYLNETKEAKEYINEKVDQIAKLFGFEGTKEKIMAIYNFEVQLAKIASGKTPREELEEAVQKSILEKRPIDDKRKKLKEFCDSQQSCTYIKDTLKMIYGRTFTGDELVLGNTTYIKQLYKLVASTSAKNPQVVIDYVMWRVFYQYINATSFGNIVFGKNSSSFQWWDCLLSMMKPFDMPLGLLYVNKKFDETSKKTVEEMTDDIRQSFINRLPQQTWMDPVTQEKAKQKALAIRISIGYPPFIKDPKKLAEKYKTLTVTDQYFDNVVALNGFTRMKNIKKYGEPVDKEANWPEDQSPANVNGFYSPGMNSITYLAGILQPPYYNRQYPSYMQYGAIGMVIGHEITHGFDSTGRKYDKDGNLDNWWSNSADKNFKEKQYCLVDQYNKYSFHGKKINGTLTIGENIADNGGIKIAYDAYQRWASRNKTEKILPGLNLTPDQLFFVGFAQEWCGVFTDKGAAKQLLDEHSPGKFRVLGALSNFEKFSKAFNCPVNSPMNPKKKCSIW